MQQRPSKPELREVDVYWAEAKKFVGVKSPSEWHVLSLSDSEELSAWAAYLQHRIGILPRMFQMLEERKIQEILVPARFPEWFDSSWSRPSNLPVWPSRRDREPWTPELAARVMASAQDAIRRLGGGLRAFPDDNKKRQRDEAAARRAQEIVNHIREPIRAEEVPISPQLRQLLQKDVMTPRQDRKCVE